MAASSSSADEKKGGELVFCGSASFSMTGRKGKTLAWDGVPERNLLRFHRLKPLVGIKIASVAAGCMSNHCLAISVDGTAYVWGRNEDAQLGTGDTRNRYNPAPVAVAGFEGPFANGAVGASHSILVSVAGEAFGAGLNDKGQLGIGRTSPTPVTKWTAVVPKSIASASCGIEHTAFLTKAGTVLCSGCPQYGQCGNGSEDKFLEKAGRESFRNISSPLLVSGGDFKPLFERKGGKVVQVVAGANHCAALDDEGCVYTWGWGAYGRLGHQDNKNQLLPKKMQYYAQPGFQFRPAMRCSKLAAGATCTYAVLTDRFARSLMMWGVTKKSSEANMYPKIVDHMGGWPIRAIAVGVTSTLVASEKSLIAFGPSPTHGELGYGEVGPKSSVVSRMCEGCDDLHAVAVSVGQGHSLAIIDTELEGGEAAIEAMPVFAPEEVSASSGGGSAGGGGKKRKRKGDSGSAKGGKKGKKGKGKEKEKEKKKKKKGKAKKKKE